MLLKMVKLLIFMLNHISEVVIAMICQYDLYDIAYALSLLRNDIKNELNCEIILQIEKVLTEGNETFEENQIRKALAKIINLDKKKWYFVYYNNVYVIHKFLKNKYIYELLKKFCNELILTLRNGNFDKAYELSDCFHCLPIIISDNNFEVPREYWKTYVNPFRKKWDKSFLLQEQKNCKPRGAGV